MDFLTPYFLLIILQAFLLSTALPQNPGAAAPMGPTAIGTNAAAPYQQPQSNGPTSNSAPPGILTNSGSNGPSNSGTAPSPNSGSNATSNSGISTPSGSNSQTNSGSGANPGSNGPPNSGTGTNPGSSGSNSLTENITHWSTNSGGNSQHPGQSANQSAAINSWPSDRRLNPFPQPPPFTFPQPPPFTFPQPPRQPEGPYTIRFVPLGSLFLSILSGAG